MKGFEMEQTKILLIDQDEANRHFLAQMLHKNNYLVLHAGSGSEGAGMAAASQPDLIISDTNLGDHTAVELISQLQENLLTAHIPYVVLSSQSSPEDMQACLQAGCAEYYVKSGMVMITMVNAIPKLLLDHSKAEGTTNKQGVLIAFLSANGGMGTSSLCANIAMSVAQHTHPSKVAVMDMVLPMGSLSQIMGADDVNFNIVKASEQPAESFTAEYFQNNLITPPHWLVHLLPGSPDPESSNHLKADHIPNVVTALKKYYDFIVVDLGRSLSRISLPIIHEADLIALVMGTNLSTVSLTKKAWNYLLDQGIEKDRVFPILNRSVGLEGITKAEAEKTLGFEIKLTVPYMMDNFALANNQNIPITTKLPKDTITIQFKQAAIDMSRQAIKAHVK
jgi:pilus assembly protein CpaE